MSVSRIYRLLRLITILQQRKTYTANELAGELEISKRTVFRDLNMLEMAQIPYYYDPDNGGYRIAQSFFLPPINLTLSEALALLVLTGKLKDTPHVPLLSEGAKAAMKVEERLPGSIRAHVGSITDHMSFRLPPVSGHEGMDATFDLLIHAVTDRKVCRVAYDSFFEHKEIQATLHPLRLVFLGRAWYVIAYSRTHREIRTFKMGRIRSLSVLDETFPPPRQRVDDDRYFGNAWSMIPEGTLYDVHVHFDPKVAGNVSEVRWHATQKVVRNEDGSIEFHARVDGLNEIAWWILGYGDQAEVIAPPALRERLAQVAGSMVARYRKEGI